jgi:hypothetical protein
MSYYDNDNRSEFADPNGRSALRAGKRCYPCPTCKEPNKLTAKDVRLGYQCDECADKAEGYGY